MASDSILDIIAYGAWNGGTVIDNSMYEEKGMQFKGGIPVTNATIEERIGIRTRTVAPMDERIGVTAFQDLLKTSNIDPSRIKAVIGPTNVGEDKFEAGPYVKYPFEVIKNECPDSLIMDLYAGCPGFNVSVELLLMLSLSGILKPGDISVVIGAENIHRARSFKPMDTSNIIFGDDAMATALETQGSAPDLSSNITSEEKQFNAGSDFIRGIAKKIAELCSNRSIDGIIIDNQLGKIEYRVPATAARVQHALVEELYPDQAAAGMFKNFRETLEFYNQKVDSFAFDIMTLAKDPQIVQKIAGAYVQSGKYRRVVSAFLTPDFNVILTLHEGSGSEFEKPKRGIIDTRTRTHGAFARFIEVPPEIDPEFNELFGSMDGKGVFLYATRGAKLHIDSLLSTNNLTLADIELLIEHQANFAMLPLTLEQVLADGQTDIKEAVFDYLANKMATNVHLRGNCSVVCMQRLPYDLQRGALKPDNIQGLPINNKVDTLKDARIILYDSVGAGMTRSSFLYKK